MALKVWMIPSPLRVGSAVSGIHTIVRHYGRILPKYGIEFVERKDHADIVVTHAGLGAMYSDVAMLHGIYFTADYKATKNEWHANANVVASIRNSVAVTVPSPWVAETLRRDFRIDPIILPHGVFVDEWAHNYRHREKTVLWAKNRNYDVCDPTPLNSIAVALPDYTFFSTVTAGNTPPNVVRIGVQDTENMKKWIQRVSMIMSTVKETWGIVYAEALAAGTPVITQNSGHVPSLVEHGVSGYVYRDGDMKDIVYGVNWVEANRSVLSANAQKLASQLDWKHSASEIARMMHAAHAMKLSGRLP